MAEQWTSTTEALPPEGAQIEGEDSGGYVHNLVFKDGLFWVPDLSLYVYFTPVRWRRA